MGITKAISRVKKGVKAGGIPAVMAELGEQLRSDVIPSPLRPAAVRLAALLRAGMPAQRESVASEALADPSRDTVPSEPFHAVVQAQPAANPAEPTGAAAELAATAAEPEVTAQASSVAESAAAREPEAVAPEQARSEAPAGEPAASQPLAKSKAKASSATGAKPSQRALRPAGKPSKGGASAAKPVPASAVAPASAGKRTAGSKASKNEKEKGPKSEELAARAPSANTLARPNAKPLTKRSSAKAVPSKRK